MRHYGREGSLSLFILTNSNAPIKVAQKHPKNTVALFSAGLSLATFGQSGCISGLSLRHRLKESAIRTEIANWASQSLTIIISDLNIVGRVREIDSP